MTFDADTESCSVFQWFREEWVQRALDFLPILEQLRFSVLISPSVQELLQVQGSNSSSWRRLCWALCAQRRLWLPPSSLDQARLANVSGGFRALFWELWLLRGRFGTREGDNAAPQQNADRFRLATHCRFRPVSGSGSKHGAGAAMVALPLNQRLALLRQAHPELSHKAAMQQIIVRAGVGTAAGTRAASVCDGERTDESEARVASAPAPISAATDSGLAAGGFIASVLSVQAGSDGSVLTVSPGCGLRSFKFGNVFDAESTQEQIYCQCGLRLVADLVNGVNGALVVYGQTGSGKTYTMFGPESAESLSCDDEASRGIAVRIADAVLAAVAERREALGLEVSLSLSYVEVFGNEIVDLLDHAIAGETRARNARVGPRLVLDGELAVPVRNRNDLAELLVRGGARKRRASTLMNERSTRAHTLLVLHLMQGRPRPPNGEGSVGGGSSEDDGEGRAVVVSRLFLADLGGSERVTKSHANADVKAAGGFVTNGEEVARTTWEEYYRGRSRITETSYINQGLLSLKRCISALSVRQRQRQRLGARAGGVQPMPVPFRDSKLTAVLEPALGGLARTAIIVCCSPDECHAEETVQTLRFGETCSLIEHVQQASFDPSSAVTKLLRQLDQEVAEVERLICQKERWEWRERLRKDVVEDASTSATSKMVPNEEMELGGFGAIEILPDDRSGADRREVQHKVRGQVLVGAEVERERLEALLEQRRRLLGEA